MDTPHLLCPRCGFEAELSNDSPQPNALIIKNEGPVPNLSFQCSGCGSTHELPFTFVDFRNTVTDRQPIKPNKVSALAVKPKPYVSNWVELEAEYVSGGEGFIHTDYGYCYYSLADPILLYNLFVEPEHRRKGYGRKLIRLVLQEIKDSGYNPREVWVEAKPRDCDISVKALTAFYTSMGLKILNSGPQL